MPEKGLRSLGRASRSVIQYIQVTVHRAHLHLTTAHIAGKWHASMVHCMVQVLSLYLEIH